MKKIFFSFVYICSLLLFCYGFSNIVTTFAIDENNDKILIHFDNLNLYNAVSNSLAEQNYIFTQDDNLKNLYFDSQEIEKVKKLELDGKDLSDLSGIEKFSNLEELILNNNKISNISTLFSLNKLSNLDLSHNCITNISGISFLTNLTNLNLYDNIIRDLSPLTDMLKLTHLNLGDNNEVNVGQITNLDSLLTLSNLKYFNFSRNNTPEIVDYITNMTKLEFLNLESNGLTNIENLSNLIKLTDLYLNSNSISNVSPLASLTNLEVLYLNNNSISSLLSLFNENECIFENIKKLHIYDLKNLKKNSTELSILKGMSKSKQIELGYEIIYDNVEPRIDANGVKFVTYDDFGARCDGIYDDMIAIKNAHKFANSNNYEVRATSEKIYHIFNYYSGTASINTNTDWSNATFIIHDENIDDLSGRFNNLFTITSNYSGIRTLENPNISIGKSTRKITGIEDTLNELNGKGYKKYMLMAENANKKISLRYGTSSKDNELDCFEIDSDGNLLNDIQWNFETVTKLTIYPIADKTLIIKNGNFITNSLKGIHDVPYGRGYSKPLYYQRGLFFWAASNVEIDNITHTLSEDRLSGSYYSFLCFRYCSDITIKNSSFYARQFGLKSRSTYDLKIEQCVNFYFENVKSNGFYDSNRWGVMATAYCKDFVFQNVAVNRIDAHQVIYNLTVKDSYLGYHGFTLTGQGTLIIENTTVESEYFINLRSDYGSSWNGDVFIINCTHKHQSKYIHKFINFSIGLDNGKLHDFGYEVHQPNLYIENFTVDCINKSDIKSYPIIANFTDHNFEYALDNYWSKVIYINGYRIINNDNDEPYIKLFYTNSDKINNNYLITDTKLKVNNEDYTHKFNIGESFVTDKNVVLDITENISANNWISIFKDNELVLESIKVEDKFTYKFVKNGTYTIKIYSVDKHLGKTGEKVFEFKIKKEILDFNNENDKNNDKDNESVQNSNNDSKTNIQKYILIIAVITIIAISVSIGIIIKVMKNRKLKAN